MRKDRIIKLVTSAMLCAVAIVLVYFINFPIFAAVPFLRYDPADIVIFIGTFLFGPLTGLIMTVVVSSIQALTINAAEGPLGGIMHIIATGSFVVIAGFIYKHKKTFKSAIIALICGSLAMTGVMVLFNLLVTPYFLKVTIEEVLGILNFIIAFNLIKALGNSFFTLLLYKPISKSVTKIIRS